MDRLVAATAPEELAQLKPEDASPRVRDILELMNLVATQDTGPVQALESALIRNRTVLGRRDATCRIYGALYRQAAQAKLFEPANGEWFLKEIPPHLPQLERVLPADKYPDYAADPLNFHIGKPTEKYQAFILNLLEGLPEPGEKVAEKQAPVAQTPPPASAAPAPAPAAQGPVISDASVAGALGITRTYNTPNGEVVQDQITGDTYYEYAPSTGYYPPYYGGGGYYPPVAPPVYPKPPRPPKPDTQKSSHVSEEKYEGGGKFKSKVRTVRPPPYDPATMTPDQYYQLYGVRP